MLRALRDGTKTGFLKYILLGFLVFAGGGLVLSDVGGFFRGGISARLVAKGSGIEISTVEFDRAVRRVLSRQGISPQDAYRLGLIDQILRSEIQNRIITRESYKLGVNVGDDTVTNQINKLAAPLAADGMSKADALKQVLRSQGISEKEFIEGVRQEMGNTLFRNALLRGNAAISKEQAADLYQYRHENRDVVGFVLSNKSADIIEQPADEQLQQFYEANKNDFLISEKRSVTLATLKKEALADKVTITEEELRGVYDDSIATYEKPEKRKLQQAILGTQNDANDVFKKTSGGKSLSDAVKDVTGKTAGYIGENDFEQSGLLEEVADPVFAGQKGDVIGPIQTALGWHVMVLKDIITPHTESFESAKKAIKENLLQTRLMDELIDTANTLDDRLASGEALESVVADLGLTTETVTDFNQAGTSTKGKDLFKDYQGDKAQILQAAFNFEEGESSPVMELADGRFVTVRVDAVQERSYEPFDSVKAKIKTRWLDEQKRLTNKARADDAYAKLQNGGALSDVAKELGVSVQNYKKLVRVQAPKEPFTPSALRLVFDAAQGDTLKLDINDGYIIGEVAAITLPDVKTDDKDVATIVEETNDSLPQEMITQYVAALSETKYDVKINDRVLGMMYGETVEN